MHSNDQVAQSSGEAPLICEIMGSIPTSNSCHLREKLVNALPTVLGLLWVHRLGNVDRVVENVKYRLPTEPE